MISSNHSLLGSFFAEFFLGPLLTLGAKFFCFPVQVVLGIVTYVMYRDGQVPFFIYFQTQCLNIFLHFEEFL